MDIIQIITQELQVEKWQVEAAVSLIDEGNTIPFISRYRKEATGALNDEQLRNLFERLTYLRNLEDKKKQVLSSIEEQGKLTSRRQNLALRLQSGKKSCLADWTMSRDSVEELKNRLQKPDTGCGRGFVPSVPAKEKNKSYHCKRKRTGTFGQHHSAADDR